MSRIILSLCAAPLLAASIVANAATASDNDEYAYNVRQYSYELVAAVFAIKWCGEYRLTLNNQYFNIKSPGVQWDQKTYDSYSEKVMQDMRKKIDAQYARLGHDGYCKTYIDFVKENRTYYGAAVILPTRK